MRHSHEYIKNYAATLNLHRLGLAQITENVEQSAES